MSTVASSEPWARRNLKALALVGVRDIVLLAIETVLIAASVPASSFRWWLLGVGRLKREKAVIFPPLIPHRDQDSEPQLS